MASGGIHAELSCEVRAYSGKAALGAGMYGPEWNLPGGGSGWRARILTPEDVQGLLGDCRLAPCGFNEEFKHSFTSEGFLAICSGLRMSSHALRPRLVALLKSNYGLADNFPALAWPSPVPKALSFTEVRQLPKVYRVFLGRYAEEFFQTANVFILLVDISGMSSLEFRDVSCDPEGLIAEIDAELACCGGNAPELLADWYADIRKTATTLAESHSYVPIDVAALGRRGKAIILPMSRVSPCTMLQLSRASYVKTEEKRSGVRMTPSHCEILLPALADGLEQALDKSIGKATVPLTVLEALRRDLRVGVQFQLELLAWSSLQLKRREGKASRDQRWQLLIGKRAAVLALVLAVLLRLRRWRVR